MPSLLSDQTNSIFLYLSEKCDYMIYFVSSSVTLWIRLKIQSLSDTSGSYLLYLISTFPIFFVPI